MRNHGNRKSQPTHSQRVRAFGAAAMPDLQLSASKGAAPHFHRAFLTSSAIIFRPSRPDHSERIINVPTQHHRCLLRRNWPSHRSEQDGRATCHATHTTTLHRTSRALSPQHDPSASPTASSCLNLPPPARGRLHPHIPRASLIRHMTACQTPLRGYGKMWKTLNRAYSWWNEADQNDSG